MLQMSNTYEREGILPNTNKQLKELIKETVN